MTTLAYTPSANVANFDPQSSAPPPPPAAELGSDDAATQDADDSSTAPSTFSLSHAKTIITTTPKLARISSSPHPPPPSTRRRKPETSYAASCNCADEKLKEATDALDEKAAQVLEVVYGKDVALDMAGSHNAEAAGEESDEAGKAPKADDASVHVAPSNLGQSVTTAEDIDGGSTRPEHSSFAPEGESSTSFGKGGQLFPDYTERDLLLVEMEGKKFPSN
ncbi:hypothetical protein FS837_010896 [Tulasnella sp. UAMH 9824]|nr:hypothetical protein FS837_010896 [Tulasnella sp. UAMH 9824]